MMKKGVVIFGLILALILVVILVVKLSFPMGIEQNDVEQTMKRMEQGDEAPADMDAVIASLRKMAQTGDVDAQVRLGVVYATGFGIEYDQEIAFTWFQQAAEAGSPLAQAAVGEYYLNVKKDEANGVSWMTKGAEAGYAWAQMKLGDFFAEGEYVPQNAVTGFMWYLIAEQRLPYLETVIPRIEEGFIRQELAVKKDALRKELTLAQVAEAEGLARAWLDDFEKRQAE